MKTFFGSIFIEKEKLQEAGVKYPIKLEYYKIINEDEFINKNNAKYGIKEVLNEEESACQAEVAPIQSEMDAVNKQRNELKDKQKGKKDEDIPTSEKDELNDLDKKWDDLKSKKEAIFVGYASNNKVIRQLIDLALLQNNMLKGEALNNFVKRSIELI